MTYCKDCKHFSNTQTDEQKGFCRGHVASVQFVSPEMDSEKCPIKKFEPKK